MYTKTLLLALAASPLVAAHGKIAVVVSFLYRPFLNISLTYYSLAMLAATVPVSE